MHHPMARALVENTYSLPAFPGDRSLSGLAWAWTLLGQIPPHALQQSLLPITFLFLSFVSQSVVWIVELFCGATESVVALRVDEACVGARLVHPSLRAQPHLDLLRLASSRASVSECPELVSGFSSPRPRPRPLPLASSSCTPIADPTRAMCSPVPRLSTEPRCERPDGQIKRRLPTPWSPTSCIS